MPGTTRQSGRTMLVGLLTLALATFGLVLSAAPAGAAGPTISPITPATGTVLVSTGFDLSQVGYQQSEFFLSGTASAYTPTGTLGADGRWTVAPSSSAAYKTRIVVRRPIDPKKFNGSVMVEWLNVSAGADSSPDWIMAHNELIRRGWAWVGVSAQAVGVNALVGCCAARYGSLVHPGDSYSYDIFTQAGRAVRDQAATVLDGLAPKRLIAAGESQSAFRLVTYLDAIHPIARVYNGFLVHSRFATGSALSQAPLAAVSVPSPTVIRNDLAEPVMVFETQGDVASSNLGDRQPDTSKFRLWETAGTSHADKYTAPVGINDTGNGIGAVQMLAYMRNPGSAGACGAPGNAGPHHWLLQAAIYHLERWVKSGILPPIAPRLSVTSSSPVVFALDANGNALGGVRSPQVDAPIATLGGTGTGPGFCSLFGSTTPFSAAKIAALYPTHEAFFKAWRIAANASKRAGYLLAPDAKELKLAAAQSTIGG
jgi:Alpha/beta hydrolase domain